MSNGLIVAYCRVSSSKQIEGLSLSLQDDRGLLEELAREHNKEICEKVYSDKGKSAFKGQHLEKGGDLKQLIDDIEVGKIPERSIIVMRHLDRLSRLDYESSMLLYNNLLMKVDIYTTMDKRLYSSQVGNSDKAINGALAGFAFATANEESLRKVFYNHQNAVAQIERFQNGERHSSGYPFDIGSGQHPVFAKANGGGSKSPPVKPTEHWQTIKNLVEFALEGNGISKCRDFLEENGLEYTRTGVKQLLSNKALYGKYETTINDKAYVLDGYYDFPELGTICTNEEYWTLQHNFSSRSTSNGQRKEYSLLSGNGILHCGCGKFMSIHHSKNQKKYYTCDSRKHALIPCYVLDNLILGKLAVRIFELEFDDSKLNLLKQNHLKESKELEAQRAVILGQNLELFGAAGKQKLQTQFDLVSKLESEIESEEQKLYKVKPRNFNAARLNWCLSQVKAEEILTADSNTKMEYHKEIKSRVIDIILHRDHLVEIHYIDKKKDFYYFPKCPQRNKGQWFGVKLGIVDEDFKAQIPPEDPMAALFYTEEEIRNHAYRGERARFSGQDIPYHEPKPAKGIDLFVENIVSELNIEGRKLPFLGSTFKKNISPKQWQTYKNIDLSRFYLIKKDGLIAMMDDEQIRHQKKLASDQAKLEFEKTLKKNAKQNTNK